MSKLVSADYSGIEAVLTGWFMRDPVYIRLARLGVHAYLTSHLVEQPVSLEGTDDVVASALGEIKELYDGPYDMAKRTIHGSNYRLTPHGMAERFPESFPTKSRAKDVQDLYFSLCPKLPAWQNDAIAYARKNHCWGGQGEPGAVGVHPFAYKHYFYDVVRFKPLTDSAALHWQREGRAVVRIGTRPFGLEEGKDANRVVAYGPQSTACGVIKEAGIRLFAPAEVSGFGQNYIGDLWSRRTPLRALVHDEFLLEVPDRLEDRAVEALVREMRRPILALPCPPEWGMGEYLTIGVEVRVGQCWSKKKMQKIDISGIAVPGSPWNEWRGEAPDAVELALRKEFGVVEPEEVEEDPMLRAALLG